MGRGRAKAKQIKVARKLKYYSPDTDLNALQRELGSESSAEHDDYEEYDEDPDYSDYADKYAEWADVIEENDSSDSTADDDRTGTDR